MAGLEATFIVNKMGGIESVNDGACALLGYTREELLALHGADLIPEAERPAVAVSLDRMRRGLVQIRPGRMLRKDHTVIAVEVHATPLEDGRLELRVRQTD